MRIIFFFLVLLVAYTIAAPQYPEDFGYNNIPQSQRANDRISGRVIQQVENVFNGVMLIIKTFFRNSPF
ncbi:hypothetical protein PVAND_013763 [Polypedilum vanderplanki]|uniref:Uncharacterized protein n=1 Tax=Polypedilum vanderplanki TaxID=319348 RepID=A0A9J6CRH2_POLVA|nr:hypothetical protein PVAND_013763 [Polypedilum vanderplanki]KAG5684536.1 hypothetical protein PVAND_013763 [Polypedilum vanderplanki]